MMLRRQQHDPKFFRNWFFKRLLWLSVFMTIILVGSTLFRQQVPAGAQSERLFTRGGELKIEHDETIMLLVSLVVVIEVVANYKFIRLIPHHILLLCSFFVFVISAVLTVAEGFLFKFVFNYAEHLSLTVSAILLAVWCCRVFRTRKQEEV